jgi:predicted HTH transcriptional regulator
MVGLCQEQGLPEPEYQSDGNVVKIVFWKTAQNTTQKTAQKTAQNTTQKTTQKEMAEMLEAKEIELTESQISILMQIVNNPKITRKEIEDGNSSITADGVKYNIARLQELGLLRREGGRKNGQWEVTLDLDKSTTQKTAQKTTQNVQKTTQKEMTEKLEAKGIALTDSQISILTQIANNPKITRKEIEEGNGSITADGVKYSIARLQELDLLHREGGRKDGQWVVGDAIADTTQKTTQNVQKTTQKEMTEMLEAKGIALTDSQISILTQIANNPKITRKEIEEENGSITADGVRYNIARLQELGLLRREGGRKNGQWEVTLDLG